MDDLFREAEVRLANLGLGVTATVVIDKQNGGVLLRFGKYSDAWRLLLVTSRAAGEEQIELLTNASRLRRLQAVPKLPALEMALFKAVDRDLQEVRLATNELRAWLASPPLAADGRKNR